MFWLLVWPLGKMRMMMTIIRELKLDDVRCFKGPKSFTIRPITFVIGENSTGKSSFLGSLSTVGCFLEGLFFEEIDFNVPPYQMGTFLNIVRKSPQVNGFVIGCQIAPSADSQKYIELDLHFGARDVGAEPVIEGIVVRDSKNCVSFFRTKSACPSSYAEKREGEKGKIDFDMFGGQVEVSYLSDENHILLLLSGAGKKDRSQNRFSFFLRAMFRGFWQGSQNKDLVENYPELKILNRLPSLLRGLPTFQNVSPVRSKPKRTYDASKEIETPEGEEVPMYFMNIKRQNQEMWDYFREDLTKFGKESGMFSDIEVRSLGRLVNDPFQLQVKVRNGAKRNIMDVGYGVSQVLPILARIKGGRAKMTLMQQPEVHLHPRGQAALASMMASGIRAKNKRSKTQKLPYYIVETHSNYMIDRVRIEIMKKNLHPDDVSLIFLEPKGNEVGVHNVSFDELGNMIDVPENYGTFFMEESRQLLGFEV